jgi:hypothetical protein
VRAGPGVLGDSDTAYITDPCCHSATVSNFSPPAHARITRIGHGPHHRALSRPGAAYQPRADVAGLAELTFETDYCIEIPEQYQRCCVHGAAFADVVLSSREISEGKKERGKDLSL